MRVFALLLAAQLTRSRRFTIDSNLSAAGGEWEGLDSNVSRMLSTSDTVYNNLAQVPQSSLAADSKFWEALGDINPTEDIGDQLVGVWNKVINAALGALNPVLALAWGVLTSLFAPKKNALSGLLQKIFERVQRMIDSSLRAFWFKIVVGTAKNLAEQVKDADTLQSTEKWRNVEHSFTEAAPMVFDECWTDPEDPFQAPSAECDSWRIEKGGKKLILELKFLELMLGVHLEVVRLDMEPHLERYLKKAARLAQEHAERWVSYKSVFRGFKGEVDRINSQEGRQRYAEFVVKLGVDSDTGKRFDKIEKHCESLLRKHNYRTRFRCATGDWGKNTYGKCRPEQEAQRTAAYEIVNGCREWALPAIKNQAKKLAEEAEAVRSSVCRIFHRGPGDFENCYQKSTKLKPDAPCTTAGVFLKSWRDRFLDDRHGKAGLQLGDPAGWETWRLISRGLDPLHTQRNHQDVYIKSHRGQYLEDRNGKVGLSWDFQGFQEWRLEPTGDGRVFIKSHRGQYLEERDSKLKVHKDRDGWQMWNVTIANHHPRKACSFR